MCKIRLLACSGALGAFAGLGILVFTLWPEPPGVTYTNFKRVEIGMSQAEVAVILGGPSNDTAPNGRKWAFES